MDSGSAECVAPEDISRNTPLMETEASRQEQTYHTAHGGVIKNKGEKIVTMYLEMGDQFRARYQITDVIRLLNSVSRICDQGNNVLVTQTGGWIINHETGRYTWFPREHMSLFQGRSAKILRFRGTRGTSGLCETSLEESWGSNCTTHNKQHTTKHNA